MSLLHDGADWSRRLEQTVTVLIGLFVFFTPFPHTTALKEATFYLPLAGMLVLALSKKKAFSWSTPLALPFALLAAWGAAGLFFAVDRPNTVHDLVSHLLKYYAVYFLVVQFYPSQKGFDTLARIIVASTALFSVGAIVYFYPVLGHAFSERLGHSEQYSFFEMSANYMCFPTVFAAILAFNLMLKEKRAGARVLLGDCPCFGPGGDLLTQTRGGIIALAAGMVVLFLTDRRRLLLVLAGLSAGAVIFFAVPDSSLPILAAGDPGQRAVFHDPYVSGDGPGEAPCGGRLRHGDPPEAGLHEALLRPGPGELQGHGVSRIAAQFLSRRDWCDWGSWGFSCTWPLPSSPGAMALQVMRRNRGDGLCMLAAWTALLIQAFVADASFGAPAIVFYLHLAMITILWKESREIPAAGGRLDAVRPHE